MDKSTPKRDSKQGVDNQLVGRFLNLQKIEILMYFNKKSYMGTVPSVESLKVLDSYFKWRRTPEGEAWAK